MPASGRNAQDVSGEESGEKRTNERAPCFFFETEGDGGGRRGRREAQRRAEECGNAARREQERGRGIEKCGHPSWSGCNNSLGVFAFFFFDS